MDSQSDADKIRNKRIAKLATQQSAQSPPSAAASSSSSSSPPPPTPQNQPQPERSAAPRITVKSLQPTTTTTARQPPKQESSDEWTHRTLSSIFRVTLRDSQTKDAHGNQLYALPQTRQELEADGSPLLLNTSVLDSVILEAAKQLPDRVPFKYLMGCWKRVMRLWRGVQSAKPIDPKYQVLQEAKRVCLSYCIFSITMLDIFELPTPKRSPLLDHFLTDMENDFGLCPDFLAEISNQLNDDDSVKDAFLEAIRQLSADLATKNLNDAYKPYLSALRMCVRYQPLTTAIVSSPTFLIKDIPAELLEKNTILGPFFALSPLTPDVAVNYFMGANIQGQAYINNSQNAIRMTLRTLQDELFEIVNGIIKSGKEPRETLLDWFALIVNMNHKRRATWVNDKIVSSDGFMVNVTTILDRLCDPFMDTTFTKLDRIDVNYLRRSPRVKIDDETKINADQKTSDSFYADLEDKENNFISEVFFLTVAAHHYGSEAANTKISQLQREAKELENDYAKFEAMRPSVSSVSLTSFAIDYYLT
jgi:ubiquitin conjugation factor E4 B